MRLRGKSAIWEAVSTTVVTKTRVFGIYRSTSFAAWVLAAILLMTVSVALTTDAASAAHCVGSSKAWIDGNSAVTEASQTCSHYGQSDIWRWHCARHGRYIDGVTTVEYGTATYREYVAEHPVALPVNLTSDQLSAFTPLTFSRRTCLLNGNILSTIVFPVDSSGRSLDELIASAKARVEPPVPSITRLPSYDDGHAVVVQTPLWVWTTDPVTETATDGTTLRVSVTSKLENIGFTLTGADYTEQWTCTPTQVHVSGDGLTGEQYLEPERYGACHTYLHHSSTGEPNNTFTLTATARWTFSYTINGSSALPIPGTVTRTNTYPVDVVEILVIEN